MKDITFTDVMENMRNQVSFNIAQYCRHIGVHPATYKNWIAGKHDPDNIKKQVMLNRASALVKSKADPLAEDLELLSTGDAQRLFSDINDGIEGNRADVPFGVIIEALNRHCPPTQYIKILDDIRRKS